MQKRYLRQFDLKEVRKYLMSQKRTVLSWRKSRQSQWSVRKKKLQKSREKTEATEHQESQVAQCYVQGHQSKKWNNGTNIRPYKLAGKEKRWSIVFEPSPDLKKRIRRSTLTVFCHFQWKNNSSISLRHSYGLRQQQDYTFVTSLSETLNDPSSNCPKWLLLGKRLKPHRGIWRK